MKKRRILSIIILFSLVFASGANAIQIKVYVGGFSVVGEPDKAKLEASLHTMLASRLRGENILPVDRAAEADVVVSGNCAIFGNLFSLDAMAKDRAGKIITRVFQEGKAPDEIIPALGKLAQSLADEITKTYGLVAAKPAETIPEPAREVSPPPVISRKEAAPETTIIIPEKAAKEAGGDWTSKKLPGELIGIAPGRVLQDGTRELFAVDESTLRWYQKGESLKLISEVTFAPYERILAVDTGDLDGDRIPEVYVTILNNGSLASQVWVAEDNRLKRIAERLPYFFRGIALGDKEKKIYIQEMAIDTEFYGDVYELAKIGDRYVIKNPIKLPRHGYVYNFNQFNDAAGKSYFIVFDAEGRLIVYSMKGEKVWRSDEKFGGSDLFIKKGKETSIYLSTYGQNERIYLQQRIFTQKDRIFVPQNVHSSFALGDSRFNKRSRLFCFSWDGSGLDEKWHTKESDTHLSDFFYDQVRKELILLEVVKSKGVFEKGISVIEIRKAE